MKMVPVQTAKTLPEHSMKVRDVEIHHALPEKFSKLTEDALLVTHTPEPPTMERLVYHMAVPTDKDWLLEDSVLIAQFTLEPKVTELNVAQTLATSDKGS